MDVNKIINRERKLLRTIKHHLPSLLNHKNYIVPTNIDELKEVVFKKPYIKVNNTDLYLNDKITKILLEIVDGLFNTSEVNSTCSYDDVYHTALDTLEYFIASGEEFTEKNYFERLLVALKEKQKTYWFYRIIDGVELVDIDTLEFYEYKIIKYDALVSHVDKIKDSNTQSYDNIKRFVNENFTNKLIIEGHAFGDHVKAEAIYLDKCEKIISILRFYACFLYEAGFHRKQIGIDFETKKHPGNGHSLSIEEPSQGISLHWFSTEPQMMPITSNLIDKIENKYYFSDILALLWGNETTEIEGTILSCIVWIGEGQNEKNMDNAFVKFWTAIETPFSLEIEDLTQGLAIGVTNLLAHGGYNIINVNKKEDVIRNVKKLYKRRSKIIHRGMRGNTTYSELEEISKYAVGIVLSLLNLRKHGYETLKQLKEAINKISIN